MVSVESSKINGIVKREESRYVAERPKSRALFERARKSLLGGVPMTWMNVWPGPFPVFVKEGKGTYLTDVDGHRYLDLCLGDTGSMFGYSQTAVFEAIKEQMPKGMAHMLPTEDSIWVGEELKRRFKLPYWQIVMTATDANRFAIHVAREVTGRKLTLVYNGCYHGSVDEALVALFEGTAINNPYSMGPLLDNPKQMTRVIEFNDVDALEKALSPRDIACVLAEPAMTDVGIIHPAPGYHKALRDLTRRFGTLLIIDETHSLCAGPAGLTGELGLEPDMLVLGKAIAAGFPAAVFGFSQEIGDKLNARIPWQNFFGFGGTLSGNATAAAAIKAALKRVITPANYDRMIPLAQRLAEGIGKIIKDADLPWYVARLGCRVEFRFRATPPKNGSEALFEEDASNQGDLFKDGLTGPLEKLIHLYLANRGILLSPYHDMALISPETTSDDVDYYLKILAECVNELIA